MYAAKNTWSNAVAKGVADETQRVAETLRAVPSPQAITMPDMISVLEAAPEPGVPSAPPTEITSAPVVESGNGSWMSVAPSPWDAEVAKASKLAATWDTSVAVATAPVAPPSAPASLPAAVEEVIREESAHDMEEVMYTPAPIAPATSFVQADPAAPATQVPSVDDMVAKVLSKMDPSVLQAMTKELLKPVIESLVREELNKK
jgi:hypothetical protein